MLDRRFVRDWGQERYAARGRPSIDQVVFCKLQLIPFFADLRDEPLPDHVSLTKIRERYGLAVFDHIVQLCTDAGLVWGLVVRDRLGAETWPHGQLPGASSGPNAQHTLHLSAESRPRVAANGFAPRSVFLTHIRWRLPGCPTFFNRLSRYANKRGREAPGRSGAPRHAGGGRWLRAGLGVALIDNDAVQKRCQRSPGSDMWDVCSRMDKRADGQQAYLSRSVSLEYR
jgi:hypothetical protein